MSTVSINYRDGDVTTLDEAEFLGYAGGNAVVTQVWDGGSIRVESPTTGEHGVKSVTVDGRELMPV